MQKILLVDLAFIGNHGGGHLELYFMKILSILSNNNFFVYACCGNKRKLKENLNKEKLNNCQVIDINIKPIDKIIYRVLFTIDYFAPKLPGMQHFRFASLINLMRVKRLLKDLDENIPVFFTHADSIMPAVPIFISRFFMPKKWVGLYVQPSYQSKIQCGLEISRINFNREKNFALPSCRAILVFHPIYQRFFSKNIKQLTCLYLPELIEINQQVESNININLLQKIKQAAKGRKIISLLGIITPRKNLPLFLESASKLDFKKYFFLVLGELRLEKSNSLEQEIEFYKKVLINNSYIDLNYYIRDEEEFSELIQLSDIVFLHYYNHPFSSNILIKVMAHRKPVVVSKGYIMEKTINQYTWKVATESQPEDIAISIEKLIDTDFKIDEYSYSSFIEDYSIERFQSAILQACNTLN
ncbi:glycosyltransferase [Anabaena sp. CA = ATCC 33047]|uniref:glycosyltransferase n=1 Tax=Anabaena sp. (strain CA / ATCC 33047) TaxID=52271 RepID=UPI0008374014|nr:glycosyltransferase [Anabaena sp. CA = ATCC 33047]